MAVTAALVKELRELTGSGMMDCKKALVETDGDIDKAVDWLREKGIMKAQKKSGRIAAEGLVRIAFGEGNKVAAIAEVNSETDFVSKNEEFVEFVEAIAAEALVKLRKMALFTPATSTVAAESVLLSESKLMLHLQR